MSNLVASAARAVYQSELSQIGAQATEIAATNLLLGSEPITRGEALRITTVSALNTLPASLREVIANTIETVVQFGGFSLAPVDGAQANTQFPQYAGAHDPAAADLVNSWAGRGNQQNFYVTQTPEPIAALQADQKDARTSSTPSPSKTPQSSASGSGSPSQAASPAPASPSQTTSPSTEPASSTPSASASSTPSTSTSPTNSPSEPASHTPSCTPSHSIANSSSSTPSVTPIPTFSPSTSALPTIDDATTGGHEQELSTGKTVVAVMLPVVGVATVVGIGTVGRKARRRGTTVVPSVIDREKNGVEFVGSQQRTSQQKIEDALSLTVSNFMEFNRSCCYPNR